MPTYSPDQSYLTALAARLSEEYLSKFADLGADTCIVDLDRVCPGDPLNQRGTIALKRGAVGDFVTFTDVWPEEAIREVLDLVVAERHNFFRGVRDARA